jgi:hypothetical protein
MLDTKFVQFLKRPSVMAIIFGCMLALIGILMVTLNHLYQTIGQKTLATVTMSTLGGNQMIYYQFTLPNGTLANGTQTMRNDPVGSQIQVEYLPNVPYFNRVTGVHSKEDVFEIPLIIAGALFIFIGIRSKSREGLDCSSDKQSSGKHIRLLS